MKKRIKPLKIIIILGVLLTLGLLGWHFLKPKEVEAEYITATVTHSDIEDTVLATGTLEAKQLVSVGAQVSGQIKKMYVQLGDQVKQGQLIAQIDSVTQENNLKTAMAGIKNQQAQLSVRQASLAKVKAEYSRQQQMFKHDATSKAELETAEANYKTAQAEILAIQAQIEQSKLTLDTNKENLGYTRIVAPTDGTIVAIVTEEGQTVNANQSAPTIVKLAKLENMTVKAEVSEADVMRVREGQSVYFTTLGDSERKHYATLSSIEPAPTSIASESSTSSSSSSSATAIYYNALFDVPNEDGSLRIDMTAQVTIVLADAKNAVTIPASAIQARRQNQSGENDAEQGSTTGETRRQGAGRQGAGKAERGKDAEKRVPMQRLALTAQQKQWVEQGKATEAVVRVLNEDKTVTPKQVLIGLNNRVSAQVLSGLKIGEQVIIADASSSGNDSAKRSNAERPRMR